MFHVTRKCAHSSQYPDGLSTGENRSTGGTRVSNPSMSSDNPSFLPDDGKYTLCAIEKSLWLLNFIIIELPTFRSVICNHFYITDGDSFCSSESPPVSKRQMSVLMDPSVKNYQKLVKSAKQFMRDEIEKVPV